MKTSPKTIETICSNIVNTAKIDYHRTAKCLTYDTFWYICGAMGIKIKNPELFSVAENWIADNDPACGDFDKKFLVDTFEFDYSNKATLYAIDGSRYIDAIYNDRRIDYKKSYIKACKGCSFYNSTKTWGETHTPSLICDCDDYSVVFLPRIVNMTANEIFKDKSAQSVDEIKSWETHTKGAKDKAVVADITIPSLCKYLSKKQHTGNGNILYNSDRFQICNGALLIETNKEIYSAIKTKIDTDNVFLREYDKSFFSYAPLSDNQCAITEKWIVSKPIFNGDRAYFDRNLFKYFKNFNIECGHWEKSKPSPLTAVIKLTGKDYTAYIFPCNVPDAQKITSEPEEYISSAKSLK